MIELKKSSLLVAALALALTLGSCNAVEESGGQSGSVPLADDDVIAAAGTFVALLAKGDFATAESNLDAEMKAALPREQLAESWAQVIRLAGPFKRQVSASKERAEGYDVVIIKCEFERAVLAVRLAYNRQKQVSGLFFQNAK